MKYFKKKSRIIWMAVKLRIAIFVKQNIIFKTTQSRNIILILLVRKLKIRSVTGQVITNITLERVLKPRNPFYQSSFHATVQSFFSSVQSLSHVPLFVTPWITARQASLSITNSQSSLRLNVHRVSDAIQPSHPLSSPSPPAPNPSQHQSLFQWVNSLHEVAKVLEFQL